MILGFPGIERRWGNGALDPALASFSYLSPRSASLTAAAPPPQEEKAEFFLSKATQPLQHRVGVTLVGSVYASDPEEGDALIPHLSALLAKHLAPKDSGIQVQLHRSHSLPLWRGAVKW